MAISGKMLAKWLRPWPIRDFKGKWDLKIVPLGEVLGFYNPNNLPNLGRVTFRTVAKRYLKGTLVGLNDHQLKNLYEEWAPVACNVTIIAEKGKKTIVWDGSHRISALAIALAKGKKVLITHVGVLFKGG